MDQLLAGWCAAEAGKNANEYSWCALGAKRNGIKWADRRQSPYGLKGCIADIKSGNLGGSSR